MIHVGVGGFCRLKGKTSFYDRSVVVGLNVQITSELSQALTHAAKTDPGSTRTQLQLLFERYTFARVFNLYHDAAVVFANR